MTAKYLIDTSAIIKYLNGTLPEAGLNLIDDIIDSQTCLSLITQIELLSWKTANEIWYQAVADFVETQPILGISDSVVAQTIAIRRNVGLKLPDAVIAATAMIHDLTLIADNDKDFGKVAKLQLLNPQRME